MMTKWFFDGNTYYVEENKNLVEEFLNKIRKIGLIEEEINLLLDGQTIKFNKNIEEVNDTIVTKSPTVIYINGFYYLSKQKKPIKDVQIILDGVFVKIHSL